MIAKRIQRDGAEGSSYARLARYVVDAQGLIDPATWTRTADYILDTAHDGAKVGGVRVTNCGADDAAFAAAEILATQARNTRSQSDKTYHLVISFPPGERPALETLHAIEDSLVAAIGLGDHQRISAVHTDTEHLHVHVAINKVHPRTLRNIEPYYDHKRLMEACDALEIAYGLQRTNHGLTTQRPGHDIEVHHDRQLEYRDPTVDAEHAVRRERLHQSYREALAEGPEAESLDTVRDLSGLGVVSDGFGASAVLLPTAQDANMDVAEAHHADLLRRVPDGDRRHAVEERIDAPAGRPGDMEAHAGVDSLAGWMRREVAPAAARASSWSALHGELARHGLTIQPFGAGMVVTDTASGIMVKASQLGRGYSAKALTDRLGPFEPARDRNTGATRTYSAQPRQAHPLSGELFRRYQRAREVSTTTRTAERNALRLEHDRYTKALSRWYRGQRELIRIGPLRGLAKRVAYAALTQQRDEDFRQRRALEAKQRAAIATRNALPTWQAFLAQQADAGDTDALAILRSRERKRDRFMADWLAAPDATRARNVIYRDLAPRTGKDGTVRYEVADGGTVADAREGVRVDQRTDASAFLALLLAADRFKGQALIVDGSDAFRRQVAQLAGAKGLDVVFADATLEALRQHARPTLTPASPGPPAPPADPLAAFVQARNTQRASVSSIPEHREWAERDAGDAVYRGRRTLADGSHAILLQRGDQMLVKPVTAGQAGLVAQWKTGATVHVDRSGRFRTGRAGR